MKPPNIKTEQLQANQLDDLIIAVKHVSDSIDNLGSDIRSIASAIEQADSYASILTVAEKLSDMVKSHDYLATTKPDSKV